MDGSSCSVLLADIVPRDIRGRVMAAIGRETVRMGAASGETGGPGVGYFTIVPQVLASLDGGVFYQWDHNLPWLFVLVVCITSVLFVTSFVRDPKNAEV